MFQVRTDVWRLAGVALAAGAALSTVCLPARAQDDVFVSNVLPSPSLYGGVGILDMRNARFMPDGYMWISVDVKKPDTRIALSFQALPWMEATFRYSVNYALAPLDQRALYDRSFDLKFRLFTEGEYTPQVAFGLQDFIGTGVYSAEYLVASKRFGPVDLTAGMGWGRLASRSFLPNPFCKILASFCSRPGDTSTTGGNPLIGDWLHGPNVGLFGGIEYLTPIPDLTLKLEYSTDNYEQESTYKGNPSIHPKNYAPVPVNAGLSYRLWHDVNLGVSVIGGREISANASIEMNPTEPNWPFRLDPQPPFVARTGDAGQPLTQLEIGNAAASQSWPVHFVDLTSIEETNTRLPDPALFHGGDLEVAEVMRRADLRLTDGWIAGDTLVAQVDLAGPPGPPCADLVGDGRLPTPRLILLDSDWNPIETCAASDSVSSVVPVAAPAWKRDVVSRMRKAIEDQQLVVQGISIEHAVVKVEIENDRYFRDAEAISRVARALSATAPADIAAFEITTTMVHMPLTTVTFSRTELDAAAREQTTPAELWESTILSDASPDTAFPNGASDPQFSWSVFPSLQDDLFDPNNPAYIGIGISGSTRTEFWHGLVLDDQATYDVWNNFGSITRPSSSVLPHVRTDVVKYLQKGATGINLLTLSDFVKPAPDVYARLTVGYIEQMFAGVGGEVLYRPFGQRWAIGADIYDVYQRNFDDLFGLQSYHVVTGHASLYIETPWEHVTAVFRAGRYLAGDYGGTLELYRRFDTGILVGAWMTLTNVPASKFGEGSFDKGIRIVIPLEWALPLGTTAKFEEDLRPIQRDGGQPLYNDAQLYDMTQPSSYGDLERQWPHVIQ